MKVAINSCFGGFSLSPLAVKRIAEIEGKKCFFFRTKHENGKSWHEPIDLSEIGNSLFWSAYTVPNPDEFVGNDKDWFKMTNEERQAQNEKWDLISLDNRYNDRTNKIMIQVVEELGKKANGACADISIVEIPDDVKWQLEEYDGNEHIAEQHRTWS